MTTDLLGDRSVTAIIATRDRPELLRRAIDAIWTQEHDAPLEIVVVFDRTEADLTLERVDGDRQIRVTTNQHTPGLPGGRNTGIEAATGAWVAFCDDDDEWLPNKLVRQFEALAATPGAKAACTGIYINYQDSDTARIPDPAKMNFEGFLDDRMTEVHPSAWMMHRDFLVNEVGPVDEEIPSGYAEDYDLFLRTTRHSALAVAPEPLVRVYWHGASFFFEKWKTIDEALEYFVDKYPEFAEAPRGLGRIRGQQAVAQAAMGDRARAMRTVGEIIRLNPTERRWPVAVAVAAGMPASTVLKTAHRLGKGI